MTRLPRRLASLLAAAAIGAWPAPLAAATPMTAISAQFARDAQSGPRALLDALDGVLAAHPELAATPQAAAVLARAAAAPVPTFIGGNLPIYQDIVDKIVAAAPPDAREPVRRAVSVEIDGYIATDIQLVPVSQPSTLGNVPPPVPFVGGHGFTAGSFTIYPELQVGTFFDDNIYATNTDHVADVAGSISPQVALSSNWSRNALYAEAGADLTGYMTHGRENTADWHGLTEGRIDVDDHTRIRLGAIALMEHEDRSSPDLVEGLAPTRYWELNGYAGVAHRIGDFDLRAGGAIERLTFANVQGLRGEINNADRNRNRYTFGAALRDEANPNLRPFVEALGDLRRYDHTPDDFGYFRNSDGYRASMGLRFRLLPTLSGLASIGIMGRDYADARFKPIVTPAADANLRWQAGENTAGVLFLDRSIEETTLPGSAAYIYSVIGGRVEQVLRDDLTGIVRAALAHSTFTQSSRWDNELDTSIGLRYYLNDATYLGLDYRYTQRVSGVSSVNFTRNEAFLTLGTTF